jgi:hypothetical protein
MDKNKSHYRLNGRLKIFQVRGGVVLLNVLLCHIMGFSVPRDSRGWRCEVGDMLILVGRSLGTKPYTSLIRDGSKDS